MAYRVLVTGSRHWYCLAMADRILGKLVQRHGEIVVVHGAAPGVDSAFGAAANVVDGANEEPHPADWNLHGRAAGPIRNREMVESGADICIAVHADLINSKGTKDCVRQALKAGIPVWAVTAEDAVPTFLSSL